MKHIITSYSKEQRDDLSNSTIEEQTDETFDDAEAIATIQDLMLHGHIITGWTQNSDE